MAKIEIERKFLIDSEAFLRTDGCVAAESRCRLEQGYFNDGIRVRTSETKAWITIKGKADATRTARPEYEYEIPLGDGRDILAMCTAGRISKVRHVVRYAGNLWEVDQFAAPLDGLWLAEIELTSIDQKFDLPLWVGAEVTRDKRYSNASLAKNGRPV